MLQVVQPGLDVLKLLEALLVRKLPLLPDRLRRARVVGYFQRWKNDEMKKIVQLN